MADLLPPLVHRRIPPTCRDVIRAADRIAPGTAHLVVGPKRTKHAAITRRVVMAACRALGHSYPAIGRAFHRDHTTVMAALERFRGDQALRRGQFEQYALTMRRLIEVAEEIRMERVIDPAPNIIPLRRRA